MGLFDAFRQAREAARSPEGLRITIGIGNVNLGDLVEAPERLGRQPDTGVTDCLECGKDTNSAADAVLCSRCCSKGLCWARGFARARPGPLLHPTNSGSILSDLDPEVLSCYLCGRDTDDRTHSRHIEHVYPLARGGSPYMPNIGIAGASCNSDKRDRVLELSDEQMERWELQQTAFARCYADMKPHIAAAFDQSVSLVLYGSFGYGIFGAVEPLPDVSFYDGVVTTASRFVWKDGQQPPEDPLAEDFLEFCLSSVDRLVATYGRRGWLPEDFDGSDARDRISEASVRIRTPEQARWKGRRRW